MKAICVTAERNLEIRDVPFPEAPPSPGHVFVDIDSATITHGDKFFLTRPLPGGSAPSAGPAVYGANASGRVTAIGNGVPTEYLGRQVAIYKSLARSPDSLGVWCEMAQLPYSTCLMLPDELRARDYCGSFANVLTVYAFLSEIRAAGHKGIVVTAGTSATGLIAACLTQRFALSAIFLVRSAQARERLVRHGALVQIAAVADSYPIIKVSLVIEKHCIPDAGRSGVIELEHREVELPLANAMHQFNA